MDKAREGETDSASEEVIEAQALSGLKVHFISLVESPANKRQFLVKEAMLDDGVEIVEKTVRIVKSDSKRRVAYGIVLAPDEHDTISVEEIEKAAYVFMQAGWSQQVDSDHDGEAGEGFVAESWLVRSGDPLFTEEPDGAWAVGIKVTDAETWNRVEKGERTGFSVAGLAKRTPGELDDFLRILFAAAHKQNIHFLTRPTLPDPKDEKVLEEAVNAGCEYIVPYNKRDFVGAETYGVQVVDAKTFLEIIGEL